MSFYDSPYTGKEIDAAIDFIYSVKQWVQVWGGQCGQSPTHLTIKSQDIKVNPDTNDRTGLYKVVYSVTSNDLNTPNSSSGTSFFGENKGGPGSLVSFLEVKNEDNHSKGTVTSWITPHWLNEMYGIEWNGRTKGIETFITGSFFRYDLTDHRWFNKQVYIHEIWRYQSYLKSEICL